MGFNWQGLQFHIPFSSSLSYLGGRRSCISKNSCYRFCLLHNKSEALRLPLCPIKLMSDWRCTRYKPFPLHRCMRTCSTGTIQYHQKESCHLYDLPWLKKKKKSYKLVKAFIIQSCYLPPDLIPTTIQNGVTAQPHRAECFLTPTRTPTQAMMTTAHSPHGLKRLVLTKA